MKLVFYILLLFYFPWFNCKSSSSVKCLKLEVFGSQDKPTPILIMALDSNYHIKDPWIWNFEYIITPSILKEIEGFTIDIKEDTTSENSPLYRVFKVDIIYSLDLSENKTKLISLEDTKILLDSVNSVFKRNNIDSIGIEKIKYLKSRVDW